MNLTRKVCQKGTKRLYIGEKGVSPVLGAALVIGIFITFFSVAYRNYVQEMGHKHEIQHMEEVRGAFLELQSEIKNLDVGVPRGIDIEMAIDPVPFSNSSRNRGFLEAEPGFGTELSWTQTDWSGGETENSAENGEWTDLYDRYYQGENVEASNGSVELEKAIENSWVQTTENHFSAAVLENVDNSSSPGDIKLVRWGESETFSYENFTISSTDENTLGGEYFFDKVRIENNGILRVEDDEKLIIHANSIVIDNLGLITADGSGYEGGDSDEDGKGKGSGESGGYRDGGGGAGYGGKGGDGGGADGSGGEDYSSPSSPDIEMGSGGGGGGSDGSIPGGDGGVGGGALVLDAKLIIINGTVSAGGKNGEDGQLWWFWGSGGGGGGGSGGGILIKGENVVIRGKVTAEGGVGGDGGESILTEAAGGGGGSGGRIKIFYDTLDKSLGSLSVEGSEGGNGVNEGSDGENGTIHLEKSTYVPSFPFVTPGRIASKVLDTGIEGASWDKLSWYESLEAGTDINFEVRASDNVFDATTHENVLSWTSVGGASPVTSGLPSRRYMQWRATLSTSKLLSTPTLHEVIITYSGLIPSGFENRTGYLESSVYDAGSTNITWKEIKWNSFENLRVFIRLSNSLDENTSWASVDKGQNIDNKARYCQYRVELWTRKNNWSPRLNEISVSYEAAAGMTYGKFIYDMKNFYYPNQKYVYEAGAVILKQHGIDIMTSNPQLVTVFDDGNSIRINLPMIKESDVHADTDGTEALTLLATNSYDEGPENRENVILQIHSDYHNAWRGYLQELYEKLEEKGLHPDNSAIDNLQLTILGKDNTSDEKDIRLYESIVEIKINNG